MKKNSHKLLHETMIMLGFIMGGVIGYLAGWAGVLVLAIPGGMGALFAYGYHKKNKHTNNLVTTIAWANLIGWLLPIVGIFTAIATISLKDLKKNYALLGYIGLILTLISSIGGILLKIDFTTINLSQGNYPLLIVMIICGVAMLIRENKKKSD